MRGAQWSFRNRFLPAADVRAQALSVLANALRYQGDLEALARHHPRGA